MAMGRALRTLALVFLAAATTAGGDGGSCEAALRELIEFVERDHEQTSRSEEWTEVTDLCPSLGVDRPSYEATFCAA